MLGNVLMSSKIGLQGLIVQSTMEAELVTAALKIEEAVFCSNMVLELGFELRQRAAVHRQHVGAAHRRQQHLQSSRKARRA